MANIAKAQAEYYRRPADERFATLGDLVRTATHEKNLSGERTYPIGELSVRVTSDGTDLELTNAKGQAGRFTHWSFGQLCRTVGAPAGYLRDTLSPRLAADCLNEGMQHRDVSDKRASMLLRMPNGRPEPIIRSITSEAYARVWDADLYGAVIDQLQSKDDRWQLPPTWTGQPGGAYRGDRDSFLILTNGGSIVTDPSLSNRDATTRSGTGPSDGMYRGLLIRNSEVGAASIVIEQILFRYICGNHMLWGAVVAQQFSRRHVGKGLTRDTLQEISRVAYAWANRSEERDRAIVSALISHEIGKDGEEVVATLRSWGATEQQALDAINTCHQTESASPRSFWGIAQGLTRNAQLTDYQDERYQLDRLAGLVLARGAKLVAA